MPTRRTQNGSCDSQRGNLHRRPVLHVELFLWTSPIQSGTRCCREMRYAPQPAGGGTLPVRLFVGSVRTCPSGSVSTSFAPILMTPTQRAMCRLTANLTFCLLVVLVSPAMPPSISAQLQCRCRLHRIDEARLAMQFRFAAQAAQS